MKKIAACLCIALLTTACGWHVRGSLEFPKHLSNLYVSAIDSKGALITEVRQLLKTNRVNVVDDSLEANYSLNILEETKDRRTAGVGGDALTSSYEITRKVNYEIIIKNNPYKTKVAAISVRNFSYNTASINSATQEENLLDQEMRRDLAQQILRRLSAVIANPPVEKKKNGQTAP